MEPLGCRRLSEPSIEHDERDFLAEPFLKSEAACEMNGITSSQDEA